MTDFWIANASPVISLVRTPRSPVSVRMPAVRPDDRPVNQPEDVTEPEWAEWYLLTPAERMRDSGQTWISFLALRGSLDPEPDTHTPFFDAKHRVRALLWEGRRASHTAPLSSAGTSTWPSLQILTTLLRCVRRSTSCAQRSSPFRRSSRSFSEEATRFTFAVAIRTLQDCVRTSCRGTCRGTGRGG